ncbi:pilus assembly PilX N-terminal domain-containing protein [Aneurinibacillus aneurinilyticus]|uniref:Uncharacterized protein n=2 Tax=Aneurinibacillus aneurinilyticus TaxID=1391 RepID=A0A848CWP9_ANEAE|nr:pilus assembly PilX N-terminal domain-containing protein [Aneurinibacillus aneurinilyticus]MCI1693714.1 hypothetical protein [Aneurinibacillus aneurinilyticus]MED0669467.1 pilus assembly PilX N-terminal domain-containing protein [Aneurinibacillus aneurinilyticus]MED0709046.1 pilus assembly PilX N-terminal domain-containing protein [Aneurinibacillus aneurinilyticus]MED0725440.1 pilus assembly PilX N-terminal domain-containing protein [Aneurinibacillus aneurinilyticus]MED0730751.1 pilus assem
MERKYIYREKNRTCGYVTNSRGAALFIVLVYVQIMLIIILHVLMFLGQLRPVSRNEQERMRLHYIAEAGVYFTAEQMLREPDEYIGQEYRIEDVTMRVLVEPRGKDEVWIQVSATAMSLYSTRLWAVMNRPTGKITEWSEFRLVY